MTETFQENAETKNRIRAKYWRQLYAEFLKDANRNHFREVRAVCYQPWPLLFNRIMFFFEYASADWIIKKFHLDFKAKTVLDVGCGPGRWCDYFSAYGARVIGADLVPELLADNQKSHSSCSFVTMSVAHLAFQACTADFINAAIVLEYVPNARKADVVKEFFRVLRPGGYAFILDPVAGVDYQEGEGSSLMKPSEWQELFLRHGFDIRVQRPLHAYPLTRPYKALTAWMAGVIKWLTIPKKCTERETSPARFGKVPVAALKKRHLFYHAVDQMILRVIACLSFPLEFLCLALRWKCSHQMFLIQKRSASQSVEERGVMGEAVCRK